MSPRIKPNTPDRELVENNFRLLATNEAALRGLAEYVELLVRDAREAFSIAAQTAVFDDSARLQAARRKGVLDGLSDFHRRLVTLQTTGR